MKTRIFSSRSKPVRSIPLVVSTPSGHQVRLNRHRANTSRGDSHQPRTPFGSVPRSKRRRLHSRQRQTIELAFHRGEPKTSGADQRLSSWLGVDLLCSYSSTPLANHCRYLIKSAHPCAFDKAFKPCDLEECFFAPPSCGGLRSAPDC